jgi:hypothetical protein
MRIVFVLMEISEDFEAGAAERGFEAVGTVAAEPGSDEVEWLLFRGTVGSGLFADVVEDPLDLCEVEEMWTISSSLFPSRR